MNGIARIAEILGPVLFVLTDAARIWFKYPGRPWSERVWQNQRDAERMWRDMAMERICKIIAREALANRAQTRHV